MAHDQNQSPPEFNKQRVWLELTNEVDRNKCEWLGRFAIRISDLAEAEGYKVLLFGWASGEPEPIGWEEPSMLRFLQTCADKPNQRGVSLHEYSYIVDDILHQFPFKLGRFQYLFATCDKHGINRPTTAITEWGWTLDNVPGESEAMPDVEIGARLYAPYSNILGAAIWYLGPGFAGIGNKAQKLIKPVTGWTISANIEYNKDPEITQLPSIGDWEQYGENMKTNTLVSGGISGLWDKDVTKITYQFQFVRGGKLVDGAEHAIVIPADIDLRGVKINVHYDIESEKAEQVIENESIGVDISHWNT